METKNSASELIQNILFGNKALFIVLILGTILQFRLTLLFFFSKYYRCGETGVRINIISNRFYNRSFCRIL